MAKVIDKSITWDDFAEECVDSVFEKLRSSHRAKTLERQRITSDNQRKFNDKGKRKKHGHDRVG